MELGLSLGDRSTASVDYSTKKRKEMGFSMGLGGSSEGQVNKKDDDDDRCRSKRTSRVSSSDRDCEDGEEEDDDEDEDGVHHVPLQLELLPSAPVPRSHVTASKFAFPWLTQNYGPVKGFHGTGQPAAAEEVAEEGATISSPNSTLSSFHMDFCVRSRENMNNMSIVNKIIRTESELEGERASSRASDDEENGSTRKKLRLSKEQSAFLEESFKEHSTLNPKQKLALAKQLNLRPRQVEVWFQNRRARTKLKQTEVDCEYLKRCCETLTEENRRLQKELHELRALKTSQPFYMQLPATTLTMCPSCERVSKS